MNEIEPTEMHQRLAQARERAGYATASDAARRFGWNENTYRSHENGERGLKVDVAYKYARAFHVKFEWLLIGDRSNKLFQAEGFPLSGYVDDSGDIKLYPKEDTGNFKRLVAVSDYLSRMPFRVIEIRTTRTILGCWPSDLLVLMRITNVVKTTKNIYNGDLAIIKKSDGQEVLRNLRLNESRSMTDMQLYPEMGPIFESFQDIHVVHCIIKARAWVCDTMEEWQALLLDPHRRSPPGEPSRIP